MIKFMIEQGWKFTESNDLRDREFNHIDTNITINPDMSVLGRYRYNYVMSFNLFLKKLDLLTFTDKINNMLTSIQNETLYPNIALYPSDNLYPANDEVVNFSDLSFTTQKNDVGYNINLQFTIKG